MKKLTQVLLLALLVCLLVLPMTFMVGAADGDTVDGYYYVDRFKTNWAGSAITGGANWGYKWVRSDGANNGSILIPNSVTTGNQVVLSPDGVLSFWKKMIFMRKTDRVLCEGDFRALWEGKSVYAFERSLDGRSLVSVCNMSGKTAKMPKVLENLGKPTVSSYGDIGEELKPFEFRLYER